MEATMARTLQNFVDAATTECGKQSKEFTQWRLLIQRVVASMNIRGKVSIAEIADDVIEELELLEEIPPQPARKTTRYFPRPRRFANKREEYTFSLAKRFISEAGRAQSRSNIPKQGGEWILQESRATQFLEVQETYRKLQYPITLDEFLSAIRSLNAEKGVQARLRSKRSKRKQEAAKKQPVQPSFL